MRNNLYVQRERECKKKIKAVDLLVKEALRYASEKHNLIVICNPINQNAYPLLYDGAITKGHDINAKTEKEGLLKGFILVSGTEYSEKEIFTKSAVLKIRQQDYHVSASGELRCIRDDNINNLVQVLCDKEGNFVTSDLDVLMLISKGKKINRNSIEASHMGCILDYEYDFSNSLNEYFYSRIIMLNKVLSPRALRLMQHGPFNRFNGTKRSHIHFPLLIQQPNLSSYIIGSEANRDHSMIEFVKLLTIFQDQGYNPEPHVNWNLESIILNNKISSCYSL